MAVDIRRRIAAEATHNTWHVQVDRIPVVEQEAWRRAVSDTFRTQKVEEDKHKGQVEAELRLLAEEAAQTGEGSRPAEAWLVLPEQPQDSLPTA